MLLRGLIAIRVTTQRKGSPLPTGFIQKGFQQLRCVLFYDYLLFKIQPGAKAPIFMSVAGIAVGATIVTTLIGVQAAGHPYIRTIHFIHNGLGMFFKIL